MSSNKLISLVKRGSLLMSASLLTAALASACVIKAGSDDDDDDSSSQGSGGSEDGSGGSGQASGGETNAGAPGSGGETSAGAPGSGGETTTAGGAAGEPAVAAGAAGTPDAGGAAGTPDAGGAAGTPDAGGAAGEPGVAGAAGGPDAGGASGGPSAGGAGGAGGCGAGYVQQVGPVQRSCAAATDDECNGSADVNSNLPNGAFGNGFDDDCDGLVDEGCVCPSGTFAGESNGDCWLVPSSQVDDSSNEPVGWCAENARGSRVCVPDPAGGDPIWSGECRGAQMPRTEDVCSAGDFDCDGLERNAAVDCACVPVQVECPVGAVDTEPYPDPAALDVAINGASWVVNGVASNWQWTVTGGDCDNILPHPSFAVYDGADSSAASIVGDEQSGLGSNAAQKGIVVSNGPSQIYPAFALSGDYLVTGEFEVDGTPYECTVKVRVRAPGIRAEACWAPMPNDVDLHFARMQASSGSDPRGWFTTGGNGDDNFYANANASWGYAASEGDVCHGWGSRRGTDTSSPCPNPRLDRDNVSCSTSVTDPTSTSFCAAENTNIDNPADGDRFAIALYAYNISGDVNPHLNVYCNGERRLAMGYDPSNGQNFPVLSVDGYDDSGDFWTAAVVEAVVTGGEMTDCVVMPVHSDTPNARDGALDYCVDRDPQGGAVATGESNWNFISSGAFPNLGTTMTVNSASLLCYH